MIKASYQFAKDVYSGKISMQDALSKLSTQHLMGESSAGFYIHAYKAMRQGCAYHRTISADATKYFLDNIYQDEGKYELAKALTSVLEHVRYYESCTKGVTAIKIRRIYEELTKLCDNVALCPEEKNL